MKRRSSNIKEGTYLSGLKQNYREGEIREDLFLNAEAQLVNILVGIFFSFATTDLYSRIQSRMELPNQEGARLLWFIWTLFCAVDFRLLLQTQNKNYAVLVWSLLMFLLMDAPPL